MHEIKVLKLKLFIGSPYKKSVQRNVWESTGFYSTTCQKLSSFLLVSVTCEAERSHPGQSRHADFEFTIRFLVERRFLVAHNENMSRKKVYHHLGLLRILRNNHPGVQDTHPHQSKYSLTVSSLLYCEE